MAQTVKIKRSAVAGKVPTTSDLELGELAVNTYDGKLYTKKDDGTAAIVQLGPGPAVGGPLAGFRNAIINGNFGVWQRGTSQTAGGYGSADRWRLNAAGTVSFSRQPFTIGQTSVPGNPTYFARYQVTVAPVSNNANMSQRIEDVSSFAGQQITVSFWAKADAAKSIWVGHFQSFGTGGSPSAILNTPGQIITLSTSWTRYSVTTTLPSVSGKTLGSDGNDYVSVHFIISNDTTGNDWSAIPAQTITFDIAQVQVEPGPVATPFERRPIGTELALCQRYYEFGHRAFFSGSVTSGGIYYATNFYRVAKRANPNVVLTHSSAAGFDSTAGTLTDNTVAGFTEQRTATSTATAGRFASTWTSDTEL